MPRCPADILYSTPFVYPCQPICEIFFCRYGEGRCDLSPPDRYYNTPIGYTSQPIFKKKFRDT